MSLLRAIILGLVQGIAEFLPISSSGHLAIFGSGDPNFGLYAIVMFHLGTLCAIIAYYYRDVLSITAGGLRLLAACGRAVSGKRSLSGHLAADPASRAAFLVICGTVPTGAIGFLLRDLADYAARPGHAKFVGALFIMTALLVYWCDRLPLGVKTMKGATIWDALVVGVFQGAAAMPGLSRSGLTIFAGVMRGVDRREAAKLSFLMAIPAMIGAGVLEIHGGPPGGALAPAALGAAVAFVSGYLSLALLVRILSKRKLRYFAGYLIVLGVFVLVWLN